MSEITVTSCTGPEVEPYIGDLAALRVSVFREFPYLYDGTEEYERKYLRRYLESPEFVMVLALDGERVVGASTAQPMMHEVDEFKRPFEQNGYDLAEIFYLGESVLLPEYRGHGVGHRFFDEREKFALGLRPFKHATFCAVDRPMDHPRRPAGYHPHDVFWNKRGYVRHPELHTELSWQDLDEPKESLKPMTFWLKPF